MCLASLSFECVFGGFLISNECYYLQNKKRREQELAHIIRTKENEITQTTKKSKMTKEMMDSKLKEKEAQAVGVRMEMGRLAKLAKEEQDDLQQKILEDKRAVEDDVRRAREQSEKAQEAYQKEMQQRKKYLSELENLKGR
jgi:hypothetical protein